ncbi:MAG: hypothetical protein WCP45_15190, partial [Verrucomicrobiota bacterium]
ENPPPFLPPINSPSRIPSRTKALIEDANARSAALLTGSGNTLQQSRQLNAPGLKCLLIVLCLLGSETGGVQGEEAEATALEAALAPQGQILQHAEAQVLKLRRDPALELDQVQGMDREGFQGHLPQADAQDAAAVECLATDAQTVTDPAAKQGTKDAGIKRGEDGVHTAEVVVGGFAGLLIGIAGGYLFAAFSQYMGRCSSHI